MTDIVIPIFDEHGEPMGKRTFREGTSPEHIQAVIDSFRPPVVEVEQVIIKKLAGYAELAPDLLRELYAKNTLAGITPEQSDRMFTECEKVIIRLREGAFPTALFNLQQMQPTGLVTQELIDSWIRKIKGYL